VKTPPEILSEFEQESENLEYGSVSLVLTVKMGKARYVIVKEKSIVPPSQPSVLVPTVGLV
jgi:hypothetical protein